MADLKTPVLTLALTEPLWARVYVPENQLGLLKYGMPASIHSDSYPDKSYHGWVGFISPTAEFTPKRLKRLSCAPAWCIRFASMPVIPKMNCGLVCR